MSEQVAAHPIWACDDEVIKAEYQRALDERDKYLSCFQRADAEAERLHLALEELVRVDGGPDHRYAPPNVCAAWDRARNLIRPALPDRPEED